MGGQPGLGVGAALVAQLFEEGQVDRQLAFGRHLAEQVIAGPETEVSADKTRATTRMFETVQDGVLQRSWCIIPGDPPGTYTYDITIDGEPRGEFVFCAIEVPDQNTNTDPRDLSCPNKFNAVQRAPSHPGSAS